MKNFKLNFKSIVKRKTRWLLTIFAILTLGVGQMWAYDLTFRCIPKQIWGNNWTEGSSKVKINAQDENGTWRYIVMTDEGNTYNGYKIYKGKLTDFSSDKAHNIQFQRLNSSSEWQAQIEWGDYKDGSFICSQIRTSSGWTAYKIDHSIAASSTVVWDMAGNDKSWAASYLYRDVNGSSGGNDEMTRIGTTTQWYKTYASASTKIASFQFRANTSNWNDYTHTTNIEKNVSGVTLYTYDNTNNGGSPKKLNWHETTSAKKATSGTKIYLDKTDATGWGEVWLKYGTQWFNRSSAAAATLVTGTDALYVITMPNDAYYEKYVLADNYGYTNYNNITNDGNLKHRIAHQASNLSSDITYIPTSTASGKGTSGNPYVWNCSTLSGHTRTLTISAPSNGSISATYTDESGTEQTVTSGSFSVAQTCKVTITATPSDGYALSALTLGGNSITSGAEQIIRADGTIAATFVAETTYNITVSHKIGSRTLHDADVVSVGITTPRNISSQTIDGFSFSSWSNLTNVTNHSANLTTDPISITSTAAGSMTCNYTQWPCSLDINTTSGNTGYTSRVAMTYDATAKAYYKEFTTTAATQYFRFYINNIKYAPSSNTEVVIAGTKVTAATDVTGYASSMPSVYFNDGGSGSKIKVWFDYEAKKAWVEEVKYTVTISAGSHGSVSPTSVSVGNVVASGTISATADDHYHWSSWDVPSGVTIVSGSGTKDITIKATAAGTLTANFAGDQYTITYRDKGDVAFSGSQTTPPTTHTYGTATTLKIPTKTGYDFGGWFTASDCASGAVGNTTSASLGATAFTDNITLYAKWTAKNYTATNNLQDADGNAGQYNVDYDATSIAHTSAPSRDGYTIEGYYKEAGWSNKIANTNLSLVSSTTTYTSGGQWKYTSAPNLHIKWQQTLTLAGNGAGSTNGSLTMTYNSKTTSGHTAATRTGYTLNGYYTATSGGYKVINNNGTLVSYDSNISSYLKNSSGEWIYDGTPTLSAQWTANKYDVTLKANTGTGDDQLVQATYDAAMPTTLKVGGGAITVHTKTGYTLLGYWDDASSGNQYYNYNAGTSTLSSYRTWNKTAATNLYAHWQANQYTVTLDVDEDNQGTIASATTSQTVYYDGVTTTVPNRPTAANGYALVGYYTDQAGEGIKLINGDGTWIASVDGYTDGSKNWVHDGDVTLYAYYKKAEITNLALSDVAVNGGSTIEATPTIDPIPTGTHQVCWKLQYSNGTDLSSQPEFSVVSGYKVSFTAPEESATYRVQATLRTGSSCGSGDILDTRYTTFQVASEHTVTIRYQDADGRTLAASSSITAQPLDWSDAITAPSIVGYKFHHWVLGDGITINTGASQSAGDKDTEGSATINIKASYAGTLTAVYTKKRVIYFNNTLGWSDVYVYFYKNDSYWDDTYGTGSNTSDYSGSYINKHGQMTQIAGTNIYYFDAEAAGVNSSYQTVAFVESEQNNYHWFSNTKVIRRTDYKSTILPMYVPLTGKDPTTYNTNTKYYKKGYWMNYPENTGYTLKIFDKVSGDPAPVCIHDIPFEFTEDYTMPMELNVYLDAGYTYGFKIYRNDDTWYGNNGSMTANTTNWAMETGKNNCGLQTTAAGIYKFNLYYNDNNGDGSYHYRVGVTYPVAVNDYRIVYTDAVRWSKAATSHVHPSGVITKNGSATAVKKDTVSFFWAYGSSPAIKYQKCTATGTGSVTWDAGTSIDVSGFSSVLTEKGVYNFIFEQPAGGASISLVKVEPYTGNYYIRTDVAGSTKWSNYQAHDHMMTYSDYAEDKWDYSHYYCHWVTSGTNVKFTIANDYSPCISDTLAADYGTEVADITAEGNADAGRLNSASANIRFMWNQSTNKISRAYIGGSGTITDRFLVLEGDAKMYDENGNALTGDHQDHDKYGNYLGTDDQVIMHDDENFVYERTIKVNTTARARLSAKYNSQTQYFIGSSGVWETGTTIELLGGEAEGKHNMRIVYDFKTNRLVRAYVPSGTIEDEIEISADLMLVREHQEAAQQLTFNGGSLSDVHTVYGVMRFNRWTLNNKSTAAGHAPLGDPKSAYERGLYWISFPFDVNLSDVFGFGTYGVDWIVMEYDGAERAQKGYWKDSDGFWKYITNRSGKTLEAGKGYVLALDLDRMKSDDDEFWTNNIEQVELFFPSADNVGGITATDVTTTVDSHACTIDRTGNNGSDINKNRTKADSHWNLIGVPSYANYGTELTSDGSTTITWNTTPSATNSLPFLYEWNMVDNTYTVQSGSTYPFKSLHAYMVQYQGNIYWSLASATPASPIVARRTYAEQPQSAEFRLELQQNEKMVDQTFVKLSNDENASANFIFDEDLCKEYNGTKANIYTFIEGYIPAAGNTLPMSEQTTLVPVGVKTVASGDYTFAIPDGTNGVGVTLIDNVANTRTNLGLMDYTVNLTAGTIDGRFVLEISPIAQNPTDIEAVSEQDSAVRKVMIDGILYIVKGNRIYDATGALVK